MNIGPQGHCCNIQDGTKNYLNPINQVKIERQPNSFVKLTSRNGMLCELKKNSQPAVSLLSKNIFKKLSGQTGKHCCPPGSYKKNTNCV